jgi:hypothetical protein
MHKSLKVKALRLFLFYRKKALFYPED